MYISIKCTCFILSAISLFWQSSGELVVSGRCGRVGLPPKAVLHNKSPERHRFDNNETVQVKCPENEIFLHPQKRVCKNGKWTGKQARCAKLLEAQATKFDVYDCENTVPLKLFSQPLNQKDESSVGTPPNTYHSSRVSVNTTISSTNHTCYVWKVKLGNKVRIAFLVVDIFTKNNVTHTYPVLNPIVSAYRTCNLQYAQKQVIESYDIFSYYYFCDLISSVEETTDSISIQIKSNTTNELGLDGIYMGNVFTTRVGKLEKPDCGQIETQTTGVEFKKEVGFFNFRCNDSFYDHWLNPGKWYKFTCNNNGLWVGEWPVCVPIVTCPKHAIIEQKSDTIVIEEIGNAYYVNASEWFAINQTWVRYACKNPDDIFVGKTVLTCQSNGDWSVGRSHCTAVTHASASLSALGITGILFLVLIVFIIIVVLVFRAYSRRVKRDLRQTKDEIEEKHRKRFSQDYDDIFETSGTLCDTHEKSMYESVNYEPRYEIENRFGQKSEPDYLDMRISGIPVIKIN